MNTNKDLNEVLLQDLNFLESFAEYEEQFDETAQQEAQHCEDEDEIMFQMSLNTLNDICFSKSATQLFSLCLKTQQEFGELLIPLTQDEISENLNLSKNTIRNIFNKWKEKGIVSIKVNLPVMYAFNPEAFEYCLKSELED